MRVKLEWLNELVDLTGLSIKEIVDKASLYSIEIECVEKVIDATNIVIGHVLTIENHPDSDHLHITTVDVGNEVLQIVCGAPNVDKGQYVIVALIGAKLPGGFEIKKSKIRGVESFGMICSLQELGLDKKYVSEKYANGIYYFEDEVKIGENGAKALNLHDEVIELGITPNRGDLLSMLGVAYEFSACFNRPMKEIKYNYEKEKTTEVVNVKLETEKCLSYYAQVIKDVTIKDSPRWLKSRLIAFGIRPINNCVDITNYILALFGQPLHAFDYKKLGNNIVVRNAHNDEVIKTLDGNDRELVCDDIVITNGKDPVALAGVMGGFDSEITNDTKDIVIEAAVFDPNTIRKTSTRLNLRSESSMRYERGVDLNRTLNALDYTLYLFKTLANAKIASSFTHAGLDKVNDKTIKIKESDVTNILGINITKEEIKHILTSLNFKVDDDLTVYVPNRRPDITIKEDLVEEIGRLYGYTKLPLTNPKDDSIGSLTHDQKIKRLIKNTLSKSGLYETVTYSLVSSEENKQFDYNHYDNQKPISLLMPLSEDRKFLRFSLVPSLINVVKYNYSRKNKDLALFEMANVYYNLDEKNQEELCLAGTLSNLFSSTLWSQKIENVDFYLVKGILDNLFDTLGIEVTYLPIDKVCKELHPKRSAKIMWNNNEIGFIGQIHPQFAASNDLDNVYVFEIRLKDIIHFVKPISKFKSINKLPSVERDIAIVVKNDVKAIDIINGIKKSEQHILSDVKIIDVYQGEKINSDEKSITIRLVFTSDEALTDEVINTKIKKIVKDLTYRVNATLRQ